MNTCKFSKFLLRNLFFFSVFLNVTSKNFQYIFAIFAAGCFVGKRVRAATLPSCQVKYGTSIAGMI